MFLTFFPLITKKGIIGKLFIVYLFSYFAFSLQLAAAGEKNSEILSAVSTETEQKIEIRITSSAKIISTIYELPNPERIVVDVANANFSKDFSNMVSANVAKLQTKEIVDAQPNIARLEIVLTDKLTFESKNDDSGVTITLNKKDATSSLASASTTVGSNEKLAVTNNNDKSDPQKKSSDASSKDKIGGLIGSSKSLEHQLPDINPLENKISPKAKEQQMQDAFNFSGYNKERITVEFQKMDLHNVFNFLRQVSGVNIVVDESVQGSLTLVLDDVPWDFALDIILNLKDLEKVERFNTLVIYPKKKEFKWPEQSQNNLSFQADSHVIEREALVIRQQDKQPAEAGEAKEEIVLGREAEKQENFEAAVGFYEKALEKWPSNSKLASKIASIYLVQLRQNAKSLYYSKIALEKDPNNNAAALNAAIAAANMQDKQKAVIYFNQCTRIKKPTKEALISFASFNEEQHDYSNALKIIEKHNSLYGEDLDALVAAARVYDKMGQQQQANEQFKKIVLSGYSVPPDLDKYIKSRIANK
jgi:type IV pilus assembly protein PilQ